MTTLTTPPETYDAVVIGGGPAGLQAALTLGRMHRPVLVLDSGEYRNDPADAMHNFISRDGTPPAELRAVTRAELTAYATVEVRDVHAATVEPVGDDYVVVLADGERVRTRRVVLATGVRDTLPDKPGLAGLFGTVAAHCPYCHGHEFAGQHVAVLGSGPHVAMVALLLERIADRRTVLTDGGELDAATRAVLERAGVEIRSQVVEGFCRSATGATVTFADGSTEEVGGLFIAPSYAQSAPFAAQLGLSLLASGCVEVDTFGHTSLPGVFAAGDLAHTTATPGPMAAVLTAAAAGMAAASTLDRELMFLDHGLPSPV